MADLAAARRYARAFMELAVETNRVDVLGTDLDKLVVLLDLEEGLLETVLINPGFTLEERRGVLKELLPRLSLNPLTSNLVRLLLERGRISDLRNIVAAYRKLADDHAGRARALVESAEPLTPQLRNEVQHALEAATGKSVVLTTRVNPDLIGGLVARVGSRVYDASLRTRLEHIKSALIRSHIAAEA